jgi:hypothetical protein
MTMRSPDGAKFPGGPPAGQALGPGGGFRITPADTSVRQSGRFAGGKSYPAAGTGYNAPSE